MTFIAGRGMIYILLIVVLLTILDLMGRTVTSESNVDIKEHPLIAPESINDPAIRSLLERYWMGAERMSDSSEALRDLFNLFKSVKCEYNPVKPSRCLRGTVQIDPWLKSTLDFQNHVLAADTPINMLVTAGSHNSFNTRSDGYGGSENLIRKVLRYFIKDEDIVIAQQEYSMTDQLNMGVRMLHLDPHWFLGRMVMCHAGTTFEEFDKLIKWVEQKTGIKFEYSSNQLGCTPLNRSWESGIAEIAQWLAREENSHEVLFVYINDEPLWDWNHWDLVLGPLQKYLGSMAFTPLDRGKFPHGWPTMRDMRRMGKRVVLVGANLYSTFDGKLVHYPQWTGYPSKNAKQFSDWPSCGRKNYTTTEWTCWSGQSCRFGPFYDGPEDMGIITPKSLTEMVYCGTKMIAMDQVSPGLMSKMVWSWDEKSRQPLHPTTNNCTLMKVESGRWFSTPCSLIDRSELHSGATPLPFACQSLVSPDSDWIFSNTRATNVLHGPRACPSGYRFAVPLTPYHAKLLRDHIRRTDITHVWLNVIYSPSKGQWIHHPLQ